LFVRNAVARESRGARCEASTSISTTESEAIVQEQRSSAASSKPLLIFFSSKTNGRSRRVEGFLSQVLQRRQNHETFSIKFVAQEDHPELIERFRIASTPTIVVVDHAKVQGRLIEPRGCDEIQTFLAPWLK
jgi:thioredoxin-like negative regulator of GroEL